MKKLLAKIFGGGDTTKAIISGIDKAWFTDQEKSDYLLKYLAATQRQNMARRLIAFIVVFLWALLVLLAALVQPWMPEWSDKIFYILEDVVNMPFSIIIGFYFAAHLARAWNKNGKESNDQ